ncbi:hypothetical protein [Escherichia coli]|uniref:hypothetical protein n=1 Tax=Escherichia coli TaxID=562 RepID=UPI000C248DD3|nr:hypothetical protein [Escherichia coli]PJI56190.1 hypothetical protein CTU84_25440 [Escherichia coli]PJI61011.1 hypothetical protein CTY41_25065 [Escherichia coli]
MSKNYKYPPGSLNIKLNIPLTKYEIIEILSEYLSMLEITFGIKEFRLFSFLECIDNGEKQAIYDKCDNAIIAGFTLASQKRAKNRKINNILSSPHDCDGVQRIVELLNMKSESNPYKHLKNNLILVPSNIVYDVISRNEELIELERNERIKEEREKREKDKNILKKIYDNKISEYSCTFEYFRTVYLSSSGFISSEIQKTKYFLAEGLESLLDNYIGKRVVRLSLKGEDRKVSVVEIYNEDGEFLFKTKPLNKNDNNM